METLRIESTLETPEIVLNPNNGQFDISGKSFPEDTTELYLPVIQWLDEYVQYPNPMTVLTFKLDYFNSSTYKAFLFVFDRLESIQDNGAQVKIKWYYREKDIDMIEAGEEFAELTDVPLELHVWDNGP